VSASAQWRNTARRIRVPLGFAFALLYLLLARPTPASLAWSALPVLAGLLLRGYASGYVRKNAELTVTGPYAHTRNPLYLGSVLLGAGFAAAARSLPLLAALVAYFLVIYVPVIRGEEAFLAERFPAFAGYRARVPRLWPRLTAARFGQQAGHFEWALYRRHREYNALVGAAAIYALLLLRLHFFPGFLQLPGPALIFLSNFLEG
jgi:protein-S-isoprenylcysteine O-methyltransferase Ste14